MSREQSQGSGLRSINSDNDDYFSNEGGKSESSSTNSNKGDFSNLELSTIKTISGGQDEDGSFLLDKPATKRDKEIFEMAEKLFALKSDSAYLSIYLFILYAFFYIIRYAGLDEFFSQMQNILSPLFDISHLRSAVVRNLAPIALYLEIL